MYSVFFLKNCKLNRIVLCGFCCWTERTEKPVALAWSLLENLRWSIPIQAPQPNFQNYSSVLLSRYPQLVEARVETCGHSLSLPTYKATNLWTLDGIIREKSPSIWYVLHRGTELFPNEQGAFSVAEGRTKIWRREYHSNGVLPVTSFNCLVLNYLLQYC